MSAKLLVETFEAPASCELSDTETHAVKQLNVLLKKSGRHPRTAREECLKTLGEPTATLAATAIEKKKRALYAGKGYAWGVRIVEDGAHDHDRVKFTSPMQWPTKFHAARCGQRHLQQFLLFGKFSLEPGQRPAVVNQ